MEDIFERNKLRYISISLNNLVETYHRIINNDIPSSETLKKSVQSSIKELCTELIKFVTQD